jgi:hypothetical protein
MPTVHRTSFDDDHALWAVVERDEVEGVVANTTSQRRARDAKPQAKRQNS